MSKSADALEYDVEAARGRLETTLADLSARFNRSSLAEDLIGIRDPGGITPTTEHLAATVRANPLPVLLIGAGFAFLAYEVVRQAGERRRLRILSDEAMHRSVDWASPGDHPDRLEEKLDEALEETFPGSDPVSVKITK